MKNVIHTVKNTHELAEGDVILHYGVYFLLSDRKVWPMRKDDCPITQGDTITLCGNAIAECDSHPFPRHWLKDYSIQGNERARWCVVTAE